MAGTVFESPFFGGLLCGLSKFYLKIIGWRQGRPSARYSPVRHDRRPPHFKLGCADRAGHGVRLPVQGALARQAHRLPLALPRGSEMAGCAPHRPDEINRRGDPDGRGTQETGGVGPAPCARGDAEEGDPLEDGVLSHRPRGGRPPGLAFLDYARKEGGIGPVLQPTGDFEADMAEILCFYSTITGRHPEKTSGGDSLAVAFCQVESDHGDWLQGRKAVNE